jgi:hypothetical protein
VNHGILCLSDNSPDMRRILLTIACLLVLPTAALIIQARAADLATGDGSLAVTGASGTIVIQGRGVIYGHLDSGTLMVLSYKPDDGVSVPSITSDKAQYAKSGAGSFTGTDVRFLFPSGRYTIEVIAVNVNASGVGQGSIVATGLGPGDSGSFTVDGGKPEQIGYKTPASDTFGPPATTKATS